MKTSPLILAPSSRRLDAVQNEIAAVVAPLFELAKDSPSLISSRSIVQIDRIDFELPKFLLLGQRGGGKPIRLALFGGLDASRMESTAALVRAFSQFERSPSQARDFALFGYPIANLRGFTEQPEPFEEYTQRFTAERPGGDLEFLRREAHQWNFEGLISFRVDPDASGFYATVRSELLGREVVAPTLGTLARALPMAEATVVVLPASQVFAPMSPSPRVGGLANPFAVELFAPGGVALEQRIAGLAAFLPEVLRHYRRFISYAANL